MLLDALGNSRVLAFLGLENEVKKLVRDSLMLFLVPGDPLGTKASSLVLGVVRSLELEDLEKMLLKDVLIFFDFLESETSLVV